MAGELLNKEIIIRDEMEGSQIYNKGYFGNPVPGGGLQLSLIEGIYLLESGRLEIKRKGRRMTLKHLLKLANAIHPSFDIKYIVYRDLRQRGYVVKPNLEPLDFRVFPRGGGPKKTPSKYWVSAISERAIFDLEALVSHLRKAMSLRKRLLLAVVDEESDLTYYDARIVGPKGKMKSLEKGMIAHALFLEDRAMILDEEEAKELHSISFYGNMVGKRLQLSLIETAYLLKIGAIEVKDAKTGRKMELNSFLRRARTIQPDFELRLRVYEDLKEKGIVVKTGFKYGSHFRAYEGDPQKHHARYLVHALPSNYRGMWPEISRAVRLAHGVRKEILFGKVADKIEYMKMERIRP